MKPPSPFERRDTAVYRPTERCGQGPYRFETESLHAKYGEKLVVYACGKHAIDGNYRLTTKRKDRDKIENDESRFGYDADNQACKAKDVAVTSAGGSSSGGAGPASGGPGGSGATAAAPTTIKPLTLETGTTIPADCVRTSILNMSWTAADDYAPLDAHLVLDVWSAEPNDQEDLVFVVERNAVVADMTVERWHAFRAADEAYDKAYMANLDVEVRAGRTEILDSKVKTPPPPPPRAETPPPRPSQHARWIPGYWVYAEAQFHWITGLWDVPEEDIQQQLTVQAPTPPPAAPPKDEPTESAPTRTAVWTPGSWQWNGRAYIWVAGAWRIPPDEKHTWQPAGWTVSAGRSVFVPGGWRIGVRIGR